MYLLLMGEINCYNCYKKNRIESCFSNLSLILGEFKHEVRQFEKYPDAYQYERAARFNCRVSSIVKLLYYSYRIRKKLEITHRLSQSTILYAYV